MRVRAQLYVYRGSRRRKLFLHKTLTEIEKGIVYSKKIAQKKVNCEHV